MLAQSLSEAPESQRMLLFCSVRRSEVKILQSNKLFVNMLFMNVQGIMIKGLPTTSAEDPSND